MDICYYDINREETAGIFEEKGFQKANQKDFRVEKVVQKKGNKLYVKWKDFVVLLTFRLLKNT